MWRVSTHGGTLATRGVRLSYRYLVPITACVLVGLYGVTGRSCAHPSQGTERGKQPGLVPEPADESALVAERSHPET